MWGASGQDMLRGPREYTNRYIGTIHKVEISNLCIQLNTEL